jgi:hypothetical protein
MVDRNDGLVALNHFLRTTGEGDSIRTVESGLTLGLLPFRSHELDLGGVMTCTK